jgi:DNA-binding PadR family transcriptional regulator
MSLAHALLTSLIEKSSSGYDLARRFDKSIGYFWHASHQQIYRELARMETAGWIASSVPPDAGKPANANTACYRQAAPNWRAGHANPRPQWTCVTS